MTLDQLEALTKAPCTSTMFVTPGTSLSWAAAGNFAETSALAGVVWPWLGTANQVNRTRVQAVIIDLIAVVLGRNRGVPAGAERHVQQPGADHRREVQQPLGEERRRQVGDGQAGPVEDPLRQPVIAHSLALCVLAGRLLRHVHDAFEACLFSGLSEIGVACR